jgi:molybdenum cofactor cytidylyltransferase
MTTRVAAVVPAAGVSARMGRSKALLSPHGMSFLERLARSFDAAGCAPVVVVVRDLSGEEARCARGLELDVHLNPDPADGPISSLRVGLHALPDTVAGCAWCPVDYPLVRPTTVSALLEAFERHPQAVIVPDFEGKTGHPVIFPRHLFAALNEPGLPDGARSVVRRAGVQVVRVPVDDRGVLVDIDTPEDLAREFPGTGLADRDLPPAKTGTTGRDPSPP